MCCACQRRGFIVERLVFSPERLSLQTVGALLSRAYTAGGCLLGAIFGTGTNGAYVEEVSKITKLEHTQNDISDIGRKMIVNTEWGAFNSSVSNPFFSCEVASV